MEENVLKEFIDNDIPKLTAADAQLLHAWQRKVAKERRIFLEGVQYHIVSSFHGKATPYAMWKALTYLFQNNNDQSLKLALKEKLRKIKKEEGKTVPTYLVKFTQCRYEIGSVGVTVADDDLVSLPLLGLPNSCIVTRTL